MGWNVESGIIGTHPAGGRLVKAVIGGTGAGEQNTILRANQKGNTRGIYAVDTDAAAYKVDVTATGNALGNYQRNIYVEGGSLNATANSFYGGSYGINVFQRV